MGRGPDFKAIPEIERRSGSLWYPGKQPLQRGNVYATSRAHEVDGRMEGGIRCTFDLNPV